MRLAEHACLCRVEASEAQRSGDLGYADDLIDFATQCEVWAIEDEATA